MADDMSRMLAVGAFNQCRIYNLTATNGKLSFTGICPPDKDGMSMDLDADGMYDADSLSLSIHARGSQDDESARISGTVVERRIGNCKAARAPK